jgi:signal transduction histidine kinase
MLNGFELLVPARVPPHESVRGRARQWPSVGLRGRIMMMVLVALLPAMTLFLYHIAQDRGELLAAAEVRALYLARAWAEHHDERIREAEAVLRAAARSPMDQNACAAELTVLSHDAAWPATIAIVDHDGKALCTSAGDRNFLAVLDPGFLETVLDSRALEVGEFRLIGQRAVAFVGLRIGAGQRGTVAITLLDLSDIQRLTIPYANGTDFDVLVLARNGTILAGGPNSGEIIGTRLGSGHPLIPAVNLEMEGTASGRGDDGVDTIFGFTQLPQTGAKIVVALSRAAVLGLNDRAALWLFGTLFAVAIVAIGGAWLLAERSVIRWVTLLGRAADAFGRGDLAHRAMVPPRAREFHLLATRFNAMASLLSRRHDELSAAKETAETANHAVLRAKADLEQRVADRTAALVAAQEEILKNERLSTLGQLTATVAHELRNPLSAIKNTLYALREDGALTTLGKEPQLTRIERSIVRCDRIISELLDYSRDRAPNLVACTFDPWLREILDETAAVPAIALAANLDAGAAVVTIDRELFRRVVVNLIDNAVQAMAEAAPPPGGHRLVVSTSAVGNSLVLAVKDTGSGIAEENLPRIFEPLFSTKSFGTGLGLPVVKRIVDRHGGVITIESRPGTGTRVSVTLDAEAGSAARQRGRDTVSADAA